MTQRSRHIVAPSDASWPPHHRTVFLGGSIEQGAAPEWQTPFAQRILSQHSDVTVFNPRRRNWNPKWVNHPNNKPFLRQVSWELDHLEKADWAVMHLADDTLSPVSLIEYGFLCSQKPQTTLLSCSERFWRFGNLAIMAQRYGVFRVSSLGELEDELNRRLHISQ